MADSVTYEEFQKQESKKQDVSSTDTESTALEDLQIIVSDVQESVHQLSNKTKEDRVNQRWEHEQLKLALTEYKKTMNQQLEQYTSRIQALETKLSEGLEPLHGNDHLQTPVVIKPFFFNDRWLKISE